MTDEFIAHIKSAGEVWDLEQTTSFLVVASTLLDLKAARLLPQGDVEDEEDLALLEARDLLFARLLQYRAFKQVAGVLERRMPERGAGTHAGRARGAIRRPAARGPDRAGAAGVRRARGAGAGAGPSPRWASPTCTRRRSASVSRPRGGRPAAGSGTITFRALAADAPDTMTRVARFLALLELFREGAVAFDQITPLGELNVRWTGPEDAEIEITDEFDGAPPPRRRRRRTARRGDDMTETMEQAPEE